MLGSRYILYISREKIKAFKVSKGNPRIKKGVQSSWNDDNISEVIKILKEKLRFRNVRLLIDDDLSYVMKLSLPAKVDKVNERNAIFEKFSSHVPDELKDTEWDYKVLGSNGPEIEVLAFAPVRNEFEKVLQGLTSNKVDIEAVEPVLLSSTRNENPVLGLAMKKDISGDDANVLNLKYETDGEENVPQEGKKGGNIKKLFVILLVVALAGGGAVFLLLSGRQQKTEAPAPSTSSEASVEPIVQTTPEPTILPREEYSINILNGTGVPGDAGIAQDVLENAGFTTITTGNAEVFDYDLTEIGTNEEIPEEIVIAIREALSQEYELAENYLLTPDSDYDVVIITGSNKSN